MTTSPELVEGAQGRDEHVADIGFEPVPVDRPVKRHRRDHTGLAQPGDKRRGFAVTMRKADPQPLAPAAASMAAGHVGRGPGLINEHQPVRVQVGLPVEPVKALLQDVRAILFNGVTRLFSA